MIKRFILWYVLRICHGLFKYKGKVIRAFSEEWYDENIKGINIVKTKEALEKQIPKKPRVDNDDWLCCLNCGETFSLTNGLHKRNKYCGNCGTKIDWSERGGLNGNR